jgi:hypothetical protein
VCDDSACVIERNPSRSEGVAYPVRGVPWWGDSPPYRTLIGLLFITLLVWLTSVGAPQNVTLLDSSHDDGDGHRIAYLTQMVNNFFIFVEPVVTGPIAWTKFRHWTIPILNPVHSFTSSISIFAFYLRCVLKFRFPANTFFFAFLLHPMCIGCVILPDIIILYILNYRIIMTSMHKFCWTLLSWKGQDSELITAPFTGYHFLGPLLPLSSYW